MNQTAPTTIYTKTYPEQTVVIHKATGLLAVLKSGYGCSHDAGAHFTYASFLETEPTDAQKLLFKMKTIGRNACLSVDEFTLL
jgi:hypothetical protein